MQQEAQARLGGADQAPTIEPPRRLQDKSLSSHLLEYLVILLATTSHNLPVKLGDVNISGLESVPD